METNPKSRSYSSRSAGALLLVGVLVGATVGGLAVVRATGGSSSASSFVPVAPVRVLDTRSDLGLVEVTDGVPGTLKVTGSIPTATSSGGVVNAVVVPAGATAVVLNVTAVKPTSGGYVSLRPGDATGAPTVSTLNVTAGGTFPNGATITVPTTGPHAGEIQVWYEAEFTTVGSTELLIDIAGYYELAHASSASSPTGFTERSVCGANGTTLCAVGVQGPGGGTIVYVDSTNEMPGYDYLEVAPANASTGVAWSTTTAFCGTAATTDCQTAFLSDASTALDYIGLGTGRAATAAIVARHDAGGVAKAAYAAGVADAYTTPTASDWFLPSRDELNEVCKYARNTGQAVGGRTVCAGGALREGFSTAVYCWSSSEYVDYVAWNQLFEPNLQSGSRKEKPGCVRPVRAF